MLKPWCLPPKDVDEFKRQILSGEIDPLKLANMTSGERHFFFAKRFGSAMATNMNTAFEEKLLLKNQQQGMVNWAKRMMATNSPAQKDVISKIQAMNKILTPATEDAFLADLAAKKLGVGINFEEAKKIADMSADVEKKRVAYEKSQSEDDRIAWGLARVHLQNYVGELKRDANSMSFSYMKAHPFKAAGAAIMSIGGNSKAIISSMDNSALLRQGMTTLATHPIIWQQNARKSFSDIVQSFGSDQVVNNMLAEIISRPTYDLMRQAGLDVGIREEAYPESLAEKVPLLGRAFRASEAAYRGFLTRTRADLFDLTLKTFHKTGLELDKEQLQGIGTLINGMTGRGNLGGLEPAAEVLNRLFFSPRNMASNVHTLTAHLFDPKATPFAKKQAAMNLAKILAGAAAVLLLFKAISPKSVNLNPYSPTFGKVSHRTKTHADVLLGTIADGLGVTVNTYKHNPTTYDISGGKAAFITLAARIANALAKASGHPIVKEKRDTWNDIENFMENKLAPVPQAAKSVIRGRDFSGQKPTIGSTIKDLVVPLPAQNIIELEKERKYTTPFGATSSR